MRALALVAALLLALGGSSGAQTPATIRLIMTSSDELRALLYAQQSGVFRRAGLDVELQVTGTGASAAEAIVGGAMDVGKGSLTSLIAAYARGLPFVLIAPSLQHRPTTPTSTIAVATTSPIRSVLDLQGKVVACTAIGDIAYLGLRALIDRAGGDSGTVKWVELPPSAVPVALESGRIDAGLTTEPAMSINIKAGKMRSLVDELSGYSAPILETAYFARRDYAEKNPDVVVRFAKAIEEANAYADTHIPETVPLYAAFAKVDVDAAAKMNHSYMATTFDPRNVQPVIDLAARYKIIPRELDARNFIAAGVK